jgi:hypothetical protein
VFRGVEIDPVDTEQKRLFLLGNTLCDPRLPQRAPLLPQCVGFRTDLAFALAEVTDKGRGLTARLPHAIRKPPFSPRRWGQTTLAMTKLLAAPASALAAGHYCSHIKTLKHLSPAAASPFTERRGGKGSLRRRATRSTSGRGAIQCRRAIAQRSVRNGASPLSGAGAMCGVHGRRCGLRIWR